MVVRFQGGHNAGHTLVVGENVYKLSLLPSGIVRGTPSVIGNGVVLDPWALKAEIERLGEQGVSATPETLRIADTCALILPLHRDLDGLREDASGAGKIGTTRRGIGPAYEDKVGRRAIRVCDLAHLDDLGPQLDRLLAHHDALRAGFGTAAGGSGLGPAAVGFVLGIAKAYTTRVGSGPFPTELDDETGERLGQRGHEFGTVTGRKRRCGWIDTVLLRQSAAVGGITGIALTKIDVLDGFETVKICTGYRLNGAELDYFPAHAADQANVEPIYEEMEGWQESTAGARSWADLPAQAIKYIRRAFAKDYGVGVVVPVVPPMVPPIVPVVDVPPMVPVVPVPPIVPVVLPVPVPVMPPIVSVVPGAGVVVVVEFVVPVVLPFIPAVPLRPRFIDLDERLCVVVVVVLWSVGDVVVVWPPMEPVVEPPIVVWAKAAVGISMAAAMIGRTLRIVLSCKNCLTPTGVVAAFRGDLRLLAGARDRVDGGQDRTGRLERDAQGNRLAGRDAARNTARMIGKEAGAGIAGAHRVCILFAGQRGGGEAVPDLEALHRIDAHTGRREFAVQLGIERCAPAGRHTRRLARDDRADGRAGLARRIDDRFPAGGGGSVGTEEGVGVDLRIVECGVIDPVAADRLDPGADFDLRDHCARHRARRDPARRLARRRPPATAASATSE
ncbi:hypothetical protein WR25_25863 [Diploscapter pachys]|uniref:Adenylosuccinate synthetase n=1 Tax=Diploscapter pachys TaxID=2018661 RepID=A0A2A2K597_9BILA|nr:hypothetical protein WR25_25863 [Diploscapter pachys]